MQGGVDILFEQIQKKRSFLCVGLDTDVNKIPKSLLDSDDPIFEFNKAIIDATKDYCIAYKPNIAFYENAGAAGWESLAKTVAHIPDDILTIADAKRGDIGNTSKQYAEAFFKQLNFDGITLNPYMGEDSIRPYLEYDGKWSILLALTSNKSAEDFQSLILEDGGSLYKKVLEKSSQWGNSDNTMYVVGATKPEELINIRKIIPDHFILVPGIGAQGGDLSAVAEYGLNNKCGLIVNSSRGIIYKSDNTDFAEAAGAAAAHLQASMEEILTNKNLV